MTSKEFDEDTRDELTIDRDELALLDILCDIPEIGPIRGQKVISFDIPFEALTEFPELICDIDSFLDVCKDILVDKIDDSYKFVCINTVFLELEFDKETSTFYAAYDIEAHKRCFPQEIETTIFAQEYEFMEELIKEYTSETVCLAR